MSLLVKFLVFGITGWILEIMFTGLDSLFKRDLRLSSSTSLWMFPIYGIGAFLPAASKYMINAPVVLRGVIYSLLIISVEYLTGSFIINISGDCPWDYSESKYAVKGIVRLDYLPMWYITGLLFEILNCQLDLALK